MKIYPVVEQYSRLNTVFFKLKPESISLLETEVSNLLKQVETYPEKKETKKMKANQKLAGNIQKQFSLEETIKNKIEDMLKPALVEYHKRYAETVFKSIDNIILLNAWVNFQKKYEYNPLHHHGGLYSFVIWLKLPYDNEDEFDVDNVKDTKITHRKNGIFSFFQGERSMIYEAMVPLDRSWEGRGVLFPANLSHAVYPFFTSDEYRISISGNYMVR